MTDWYIFGHYVWASLKGHHMMGNGSKNNVEMKGDEFSDEAKDLVRKLTEKDPMKRLGIENGFFDIAKHPFFAGVDWEKLKRREYILDDRPGSTMEKIREENEGVVMDQKRQNEIFYGRPKKSKGDKISRKDGLEGLNGVIFGEADLAQISTWRFGDEPEKNEGSEEEEEEEEEE